MRCPQCEEEVKPGLTIIYRDNDLCDMCGLPDCRWGRDYWGKWLCDGCFTITDGDSGGNDPQGISGTAVAKGRDGAPSTAVETWWACSERCIKDAVLRKLWWSMLPRR